MTDLRNDILDVETQEPLGVQGDGEPVAVATEEAVPQETETQETEEATETTQAAEDRRKKETGSHRAREKAKRLEAELAQERELNRRLMAGQTATPAKPATDSEPDPDKFETVEAYQSALIDYRVEQKIQAREQKAESAKRMQSWEDRVNKAREEFEDFDEAIESAENPSQYVAQVLLESQNGPKIAYKLANDPDLYRKINQMSAYGAAMEIAKIELSLGTTAEKPKPKTTSAPKPPTTVSTPAAVPGKTDGRNEVY